jgi:mono/diheme cytochrome c family protein
MTTARGIVVMVLMLLLAGCRGGTSTAPPIHINPNMDLQERYDPQEENTFFADRRSMRPPVAGTVARGFLREDTAFHFGRVASGDFVSTSPVSITAELMVRGEERYEIFCAVCHGSAGDGQGIIMTGGYGYVPAPTYHSDLLRSVPDGYMFDVISNGVRSMPGYAQQIPVTDRWAITAYLRALQRSQNAQGVDVAGGSQNVQSAGASSAK